MFREKIIDYIFCTSTLLEGVNLPAKNIFILSNAIGKRKFSDIDFWNLAGRAGRLTKELYGNIICTRAEEKGNRWDRIEKDLDVVRNKKVKDVKPILIGGKKNFYTNLERSILDEPFTLQNASNDQQKIWNTYANIAVIHEIIDDNSVLRKKLIEKRPEIKKVLEREKKNNIVPEKILLNSSTIKLRYQNKILKSKSSKIRPLSDVISYDYCLENLKLLSLIYNWSEEESGGFKPLFRSEEVLKYYAVLMNSWMTSDPINKIIQQTIQYYVKRKTIWITDKEEFFNRRNKKHINIVINQLISDIDNILRYKLEVYFNNYYSLLKEKLDEKKSGANWAVFLEYGTTNNSIIELQNIGLPRHIATFLLKEHSECLEFEDKILINIDIERLKKEIDPESSEYREIFQILG